MVNVVRPGALENVMVPSWSVTIRCAMDNPSPVPCGLVVKNGSKIEPLGAVTPGPVSSTSTT